MYTIAHRGLAEDYPENTLTAIRESSKTCDIIEIDVRETADGELIVLHDDTLERVTDESNKSVYLHSLTDLRGELVEGKEVLPTLAEAIRASSVPVLLDLKGPMDIENVIKTLEEVDHTIFVQSFHPSHFREISQKWDGRTGLLVPSEMLLGERGVPIDSITSPTDGIEFITENDGDFISLYHQFCTETVVDVATTHGLDVFGWTVRETEIAQRLVEVGVDGVTTDSLSYLD